MKSTTQALQSVLIIASIMAIMMLNSCKGLIDEPRQQQPPKEVEGYAPIYDNAGAAKNIHATDARAIQKGGKIYTKDDILFQVENGKGIHVIDISDPKNPQKLKFIEIGGCQEIAMMDQYLYANNLNDLVVLDMTDYNTPVVKDRIVNTFHIFDPNTPPGSGWYECIDPSKGEVIGWEIKTLYRPQCR